MLKHRQYPVMAFLISLIFLAKCAPYNPNNFISSEVIPAHIPSMQIEYNFSINDRTSTVVDEMNDLRSQGFTLERVGESGLAFYEDIKNSYFDNRSKDSEIIIINEFNKNVFDPKKSDPKKYGKIKCSVIYTGNNLLNNGVYYGLGAASLGLLWLLGMPMGEQTASLGLVVQVYDNLGNLITKYQTSADSQEYGAIYYGYPSKASFVYDRSDLTRAALSKALNIALLVIKSKIINDAQKITDKLMSPENISATAKLYELPAIE